ncbi:amidohydrolase family protein [Mesorhizobium sp. VNQ89]|uniref:dihydroorotase n=1 Tax=Mesorhizobium quangtriensis TaxID=3157709 RepID=UPI0032B7A7E1
MTAVDLVVRGERVLLDGQLRPATVLVGEGRIVGIMPGRDAEAPSSAARVIDAGADVVAPGFIDVHVHFDNPAIDLAEDFHFGTANASLGGCTFVIEHPFSNPLTTTAARYEAKRKRAAERAFVDFGLWGALTAPSLNELGGQRALGALGFKAFLPDNSMNFPPATDDDLRKGLAFVAREGGFVLVHAEDRDALRTTISRERQAGRTGYGAVLASRAPEIEVQAVRHVLEIAEETGGAVHLVHLSVPESVDLVDAARARGVQASCEAMTHHLLLDSDALPELGWRALCAPPLRSRAAVEGLWQRLRDGLIDVIASDHCPYRVVDKVRADINALDGPFGIQSVREFAPLFLDEALRRGWTLPEALALVTSRPADLCGVAPRKGRIAVGADADFAILQTGGNYQVDAQQQFGPDKWSPYDGRPLGVRIDTTILRGKTLVSGGKIVVAGGDGRFLSLAPAAPVVSFEGVGD